MASITIVLDEKVQPDAEIVSIDLAGSYVDFKNSDGINRAPLGEIAGDVPTVEELTAAVAAVLGDKEEVVE